MHSRCCWPPDSDVPPWLELVLDLVPQRGAPQAALDDLVELGGLRPAGQPEPGGDVVVDRHRRERVGSLEDHADDPAERDRVDRRAVDVLAVEPDGALDPRPGGQLVHPVERAQEGALAAAGRADDRRDRMRLDGQRDVPDGAERAVVDVELGGRRSGPTATLGRTRRRRRGRAGVGAVPSLDAAIGHGRRLAAGRVASTGSGRSSVVMGSGSLIALAGPRCEPGRGR